MGWEVLRDPDREIMVFIDNTEDVAFGPIFYAFD